MFMVLLLNWMVTVSKMKMDVAYVFMIYDISVEWLMAFMFKMDMIG